MASSNRSRGNALPQAFQATVVGLADGLPAVSKTFLMLAERVVRAAAGEVCLGHGRLELDGAVAVGESGIRFAKCGITIATGQKELYIARIDGDGSSEILNRAGMPAAAGFGGGAQSKRLGVWQPSVVEIGDGAVKRPCYMTLARFR
jgi:hypothetical protein